MKDFFIQNQLENCSFDGTTIGDSLKITTEYVPLQMGEYQPNCDSDETGHLHTRKEIVDRSKNSISGILPKDFFERSRQHICDTPDYKKAPTEQAKEKVLKEKGNIVGIIGQAGVGKSTLMKKLLCRNVTDERLYEADFVFYVKLRDFFNETEMNLFQFLMGNTTYNSCKWMKNAVIREGVLKLLSESKLVCILLDGLDELNIDMTHLKKNSKIMYDINSQNSPKNFILGLLSGQILPNAKKLITSRPDQMLKLPDIYKPKFIVKIFGIEKQGIKQICLDICDDDNEYSSQVLSHIESQPDLFSYCYVPINCVLTVHCIYHILKAKTQKSLPKNITSVFVLTLFCFSKTEHMREHLKEFDIKNFSDLEKICKLAWSGINNQKLYFDEKDLKAADLIDTNISNFTVTVKQKNILRQVDIVENAHKNCIYFSHLLLQEFFAAVFCLHFMNFENFNAIIPDFNLFKLIDNRFEMIIKFMFGLSNPETFKTLKKIYPNISKATQHLKPLKDLAITILRKRSPENTTFSDYLRVCCWAYEIQDPEFCKKLVKSFKGVIKLSLTNTDLLSNDILSLCYVIKVAKTKLHIHLSSFHRSSYNKPSIFINLLHLFCKEMESILKDSSNIMVIILT